jgi:uncharacterized protein (TIGR03086 family)
VILHHQDDDVVERKRRIGLTGRTVRERSRARMAKLAVRMVMAVVRGRIRECGRQPTKRGDSACRGTSAQHVATGQGGHDQAAPKGPDVAISMTASAIPGQDGAHDVASAWTGEKVEGTTDLAATTPCDEWQVRDLLNHMLETQRYFVGAASGKDASPPGPNPGDHISDNPAADLAQARSDVIETFGEPGVIEKTGPSLGIAFADQLLHGWDLARATGQDATMPTGLAEAAYELIHGTFTEKQRNGIFKPAIEVSGDAAPQQKLLAFTGRQPD